MRRIVAIVALVVVASTLGWWAGRTTLVPAATSDNGPGASRSAVTTQVVEATVGRTVGVTVTLRQPVDLVATNTLSGMVTDVRHESTYDVGATVYAVAGLPVRVIAGQTPFYRDLGGGSRGPDVEQLQLALVELGYLEASDGVFGTSTAAAIRDWQAELGLERTGVVLLGEVLAVPTLPATLRPGSQISKGVLLAGGEDAILAGSGVQTFVLVLSSDQARLIHSETPIVVRYEQHAWDASVTSATVDDSGNTVLTLEHASGGPVCGADCAELPPDEELGLRAQAQVVPDVTGPAVPAVAVRTAVDGGTYVTLEDGSRREVQVRGSGQGLVIVDGLDEGEHVEVPLHTGPDGPEAGAGSDAAGGG